MFYGKMWLVVKPTVGLPLFFGGVATTSLLVHYAVLSHTTWYPAFLEGHPKDRAALMTTAAPMPPPPPAATINVAPSAPAPGPSPSVVINVAPK